MTVQMKGKRYNLGLILTSLLGYLEWGEDQSMFLFQGAYDVLVKLFTDPASVVHPITLLPLLGQIVLIISLFQKRPSLVLTIIGFVGLGALLLVILVVGLLNWNIKMILSTLLFWVAGGMMVRHHLKNRGYLS